MTEIGQTGRASSAFALLTWVVSLAAAGFATYKVGWFLWGVDPCLDRGGVIRGRICITSNGSEMMSAVPPTPLAWLVTMVVAVAAAGLSAFVVRALVGMLRPAGHESVA